MAGWIKLHRKLKDSLVFDNPDLLKVWIWCLLKATHDDYIQMIGLQEVELKKGQFIFGRKVAANELKMSESKTYRLIKKLENMQNLNIKANNKFSVITIENWEIYQSDNNNNEQQSEQQMNNKRTTNEQQMNTNKNKRTKEHKNIYKDIAPELVEPLKDFEEMRKKIKAPLTDKARTMLINNLNKLSDGDNTKAVAILNQSTMNCWKSVYQLKEDNKPTNTPIKPNKFHNFEQTISNYSESNLEEIAERNNKKKLERLGIG